MGGSMRHAGSVTPDLLASLEQAKRDAETRRRKMLDEVNREIRALDRAVKALKGEPVGNDKSDPVKVAGRKNVEAVRAVMAERGECSQAEVGRVLDMNSGTLSWAFKALEREGAVVPTTMREGRSTVWAHVKAGGAKARQRASGQRGGKVRRGVR